MIDFTAAVVAVACILERPRNPERHKAVTELQAAYLSPSQPVTPESLAVALEALDYRARTSLDNQRHTREALESLRTQ